MLTKNYSMMKKIKILNVRVRAHCSSHSSKNIETHLKKPVLVKLYHIKKLRLTFVMLLETA